MSNTVGTPINYRRGGWSLGLSVCLFSVSVPLSPRSSVLHHVAFSLGARGARLAGRRIRYAIRFGISFFISSQINAGLLTKIAALIQKRKLCET